MSLRRELMDMFAEMDDIHNISYQLWTWLPSYQEYDKDVPSDFDIISEACDYICKLRVDLAKCKNGE